MGEGWWGTAIKVFRIRFKISLQDSLAPFFISCDLTSLSELSSQDDVHRTKLRVYLFPLCLTTQ